MRQHALVDRPATIEERDIIRNLLRTHDVYRGSGNGGDACEKALCGFYNTNHHGISTSYFDLFLNDWEAGTFSGVSVKKKGVSTLAELNLAFWGSGSGRMELSNISTWWKHGHMDEFTMADFVRRRHVAKIGALVLKNLRRLKEESPQNFKTRDHASKTGLEFDLSRGRFLNILWNRQSEDVIVLSFDTTIPEQLKWVYEGEALVGYRGKAAIVKWYGTGRGHVFYTPPVSESLYRIRL